MTRNTRTAWMTFAAAIALVAFAATPAQAYAGPGAGLTVIGAALAFVGAIFLAIAGFVWYPIKRLLRGRTSRSEAAPDAAGDSMQR